MELNEKNNGYILIMFAGLTCNGSLVYAEELPLGCSTSDGNTRFFEKWIPKNNLTTLSK